MILIEKTSLDFSMENESFACKLYGRWDEFCRVSVEEVIDEVFSRYDTPDQVIRLDSLALDLGNIGEDEFYERFPRLLAQKLDEAFSDCLRHQESYSVKVIPVRESRMEILLFYLRHGFLPENASHEYRNVGELLRTVIRESGNQFIRLLRQEPPSERICERLALQFSDEELGWIVEKAEPMDSGFIMAYVHYLIVSHTRLRSAEITVGDYRNVVWQVVWAYLLFDGRGYFNRKEMVWQTIRGLAARFNLEISYLLQLLTSGLNQFSKEWTYVPELLMIFSDIRKEIIRETMDTEAIVALIDPDGKVSEDDLAVLRRLLSRSESCRKILSPLTEEEIVGLVKVVVPEESDFIVSYARSLDKGKERGMLEGKAGSEFRILKWEFLFLVLLDFPGSSFQRKRFVWSVICQIAAHYNVEALALLAFLYADTGEIPKDLTDVLKELYQEQMGEITGWVESPSSSRGYSEQGYARLVYILSHPLLARKLLSEAPEERIHGWVKKIIPSESVFIIAYAQGLDKEKERGLFEGKAGTEFRVLKWEFIFMVVLSAPVSSFQRKQFVRSVLRQMAAHYNLSLVELLDYFYGFIRKGLVRLPLDLTEVISELWGEEKMTAQNESKSEEDEKQFMEVFSVLCARNLISEQEWQAVGFYFSLSLLVRSDRNEVATFIRKHKEGFWRMLFHSQTETKVLFDRICKTKGLLAFLVAEYGQTALINAFERAGVNIATFVECGWSDWKKLCEKKDTVTMLWWLKNSPATVAKAWHECPAAEENRFLETVGGNEELQQEWLWKIGSGTLRQVVERIRELQKSFFSFPAGKIWYSWLIPFTAKRYANFSYEEILVLFWQKLATYLSENERKGIERMILECEISGFDDFKQMMMKSKNVSVSGNHLKNEPDENPWRNVPEEENTSRFFIENAGLVLLAVYVPQLFSILKCTEQREFVSDEMRTKGVFLLQRLLYDQEEFTESDLILNKLLVGYDIEKPLPRSVDITEDECKTLTSMLQGVKGNWDKMQNTTLEGFRQSFLIRNGILEESEDIWQLAVEERGYDMLLGSLPWSYSPVKLPWMEKPIYVKWKN